MAPKRKAATGKAKRSATERPARKPAAAKPSIVYHKDGSVWAKGGMTGGTMTGYWEWFRKDGTILRSGFFDKGKQTGNWTTYDKAGKVYKVTQMKVKP